MLHLYYWEFIYNIQLIFLENSLINRVLVKGLLFLRSITSLYFLFLSTVGILIWIGHICSKISLVTMYDQIDTPVTEKRVRRRISSLEEISEELNPPKKRDPLLGLLGFVVLKILFVDIPILVGDVGSNFCVSWQLYKKFIEDNDIVLFKYAVIVTLINWFPGIVAAIHFLSMYRHKWGLTPQAMIFIVLLLLVFYPVVPLLAYIVLLYYRPKVRQTIKHVKIISSTLRS